MLHIATAMSSHMHIECRHKQREKLLVSYYAQPMALRIADLRKARGWSQDDLASKAGISRSQLTQIENETRPANTLRLNAIADALGVPPYKLFAMSDYDQILLDLMPKLQSEDRQAIIKMAKALAAQNEDD